MSDVLPNATPEGQVKPEGEQVAEQTTGQVSAQTQQPQTDKPLTLDDVQREATRIAQSLVAKGENRINQRMQEQFRALDISSKALGLSEEQVTQAKQKIVMDAFTASEPETTGEQPGTGQTVDPATIINDFLGDVFEVAGTKVDPNDPEWKQIEKGIDDTWNDPKGHIKLQKIVTDAARQKAERTASLKEKAAARVVSGGQSGTGESNAKNASELWDRAYK